MYCLLIALDAHMFSHNGSGPGIKAQGPRSCGPPGPGPAAPWALVIGPGPISVMGTYGCTYVHQWQSIGNK